MIVDPTKVADQVDVEKTWDATTYVTGRALHVGLLTVGASIIGLGVLTIGIAGIDRALDRRREVVGLQVIGTPRRVIRRVQWIESLTPLLVGVPLAGGLGLLCGAAMLSVDPGTPLPVADTLAVSAIALALGLCIAAIAVVTGSPRIRAAYIRTE